MGKSKKIGKSRRDTYYYLAKESGYRARSAFKLLQLNGKYDFFSNSLVCLDLCAAPGGWLQVASQKMPLSSVIIGIDLVPIKPVPGCRTIQADITTVSCRQQIRQELKDWSVDVVLHDGAPNIGGSWQQEAFQQAILTLRALKIATEFLREHGWFVTKLFRSKDSNSLLWVLSHFFRKVHTTKPVASRNESAEIFVICEKYLKPTGVDSRLLDEKYVFSDIHQHANSVNETVFDETRFNTSDFASVPVSLFLEGNDYMELLSKCYEFTVDDPTVGDHPLTTNEIKELLKDLKVLGKRELKTLITWRRNMKKILNFSESLTSDATVKLETENHNENIELQYGSTIRESFEKNRRKKLLRQRRRLLSTLGTEKNVEAWNDDPALFGVYKYKNLRKHKIEPYGTLFENISTYQSDLADNAFTRYVKDGDECLPEWFVGHDKKRVLPNIISCKPSVHINCNPIKKVVEARERKRRHKQRALQRRVRKAEIIMNTEGMSNVERTRRLNQLNKRSSRVVKKKHGSTRMKRVKK